MKLENLIRSLMFTPGVDGRWGLPVLVWGRPGTGKTSRIRAAVESAGMACETIISSLREPADFLGLPIPDGEGAVRYAPPAWARRASNAGRTGVILDELTTCPPSVQAALLRTVHEGCVGDLQLPPGVRFVAAANAVSDISGGYDLSPPLANRFVHLSDLDVSVAEWSEWALAGGQALHPSGGDPETHEKDVLKAWPEAYAKARGLVTSFLRRHDLLMKLPKDNDPNASKAWPSPRSWELAMRAMAGGWCNGLSPVEVDALVAGCVGEGAATALAAYLKDIDLPDPAKLLDGQETFKADKRLDRIHATLSACAALVCPADAKDRLPRAKKLWAIMGKLVDKHADLVYLSAHTLATKGLGGLVAGKEAQETLAAIQPAAAASGKAPKVSKAG